MRASFSIKKVGEKVLQKVGQVLQSGASIAKLKNFYYKVRQLLQSGTTTKR